MTAPSTLIAHGAVERVTSETGVVLRKLALRLETLANERDDGLLLAPTPLETMEALEGQRIGCHTVSGPNVLFLTPVPRYPLEQYEILRDVVGQ